MDCFNEAADVDDFDLLAAIQRKPVVDGRDGD